ncbi:Protein of unknown function (DUF3285) [Xenococcus sp. PCC 7305]|uniref:DUF3285 domain-containing protein n=1 Tax=Xenococcus sp. PCC 7305 TaxID=102125 RepID=UPI0002AB9B1B|nr:DUF3285 domain-containing protein [Xenococcus sp. PCC 7305]ELS00611.1 Protein of unknown function (DUF3285) [Xenococcus sp. PCC 7305]
MTISPESPEQAATEVVSSETPETLETPEATEATPPPTYNYVKLAMRNMVRKKGQSIKHFTLTVIGLLTVLIGLSYLTKP